MTMPPSWVPCVSMNRSHPSSVGSARKACAALFLRSRSSSEVRGMLDLLVDEASVRGVSHWLIRCPSERNVVGVLILVARRRGRRAMVGVVVMPVVAKFVAKEGLVG